MLSKYSAESRKVSALYDCKYAWIIMYDEKFVGARKKQTLRRKRLLESINETTTTETNDKATTQVSYLLE